MDWQIAGRVVLLSSGLIDLRFAVANSEERTDEVDYIGILQRRRGQDDRGYGRDLGPDRNGQARGPDRCR